MKRYFLLLILLLSLAVLIPAGAETYELGDTADDFTITTVEGETLSLSGLLSSHKAVLINFWFINCSWCEYEFPYLQQAYEKMGNEVAVLALSPYDSEEDIRAYQQSMNLTFPMAQDTAGLSERFGCTGYPTTVMIDRHGVYCFSHSGAITSESAFLRLMKPFAAEDYASSLVGFEIPPVQPSATMPPAENMALALNSNGSDIAYSTLDGAWPWLLKEEDGRSYAYSSNSGEDSTSAVLHASFTASKGDVLAFDYAVSSTVQDDFFALFINEEPVKVFSGERAWQSYAYALAQDGTYEIDFAYLKNNALSGGNDTAFIDNVRLLSGQEAQEALDLNPSWPQTAQGNAAFDVLNEDARPVVIDDPSGTLSSYYPGAGFYLVPGTELELRVRIGKDVDAEAASLYSFYDGSQQTLDTLKTDETGFLVTLPSDSLETTGYPWSALVVYPYFNDYETIAPLFWFASEADLDSFCQSSIAENVTAAWKYADEKVMYTLRFTDEAGAPLAGVIANICDESTCMPLVSDENGVISFENVPYPYDVHVIRVPEGYAFDPSKPYTAPLLGGEMQFTFPQSNAQ
ncbi:MAG: TlpA family protein disulfide reductase [Clostridia bacterium]|nr:TlpA family protein disulfide reductase [Clostridia bacterium]